MGVTFVDDIDLNAFKSSVSPMEMSVNNYFERVQINGPPNLYGPAPRCRIISSSATSPDSPRTVCYPASEKYDFPTF